MNTFIFDNRMFRIACDTDVPKIRKLVNAAYAELSEMGFNYTGSYQDEAATRRRISEGRAFLLEESDQLIGTVLLKKENKLTGRNSAYVSQLAVDPLQKKRGLGNLMMNMCEAVAKDEDFESVQLDTAKPATHLVSWYLRRGYEIVGETKWEGKTYESWIFEKILK